MAKASSRLDDCRAERRDAPPFAPDRVRSPSHPSPAPHTPLVWPFKCDVLATLLTRPTHLHFTYYTARAKGTAWAAPRQEHAAPNHWPPQDAAAARPAAAGAPPAPNASLGHPLDASTATPWPHCRQDNQQQRMLAVGTNNTLKKRVVVPSHCPRRATMGRRPQED